MSRIRLSNQFWCLLADPVRALANLRGKIHPVEVKWILSGIYKIGDVKLENPSEKYLLLQPASTIPMGSTYGIFTNMVLLKIKSSRWFDVTLFTSQLEVTNNLWVRVTWTHHPKKGHELNHLVPSYFSEPGNLQWDFGETVKGCYKHIELYQHPKPHPLHPQERRHIQLTVPSGRPRGDAGCDKMGTLVAWSFLKKALTCQIPAFIQKFIQTISRSPFGDSSQQSLWPFFRKLEKNVKLPTFWG